MSYGRPSQSAHDRTRTCTSFPTLVPQTSLSTNSSTWAASRQQPAAPDHSQIGRRMLPKSFGMLGEGLEPSRGFPHRILNPARLPIPPPERPSGAEGNRTPDLLNAIQALSQLSYGPNVSINVLPIGRSALPRREATLLAPPGARSTELRPQCIHHRTADCVPSSFHPPKGNRTPISTLKEWCPSR